MDGNGKEQERGRPRRMDWNVILLAIIAATPPTIMAWHAGEKVAAVEVKVDEVHRATNGLTAKLEAAAVEKGRGVGIEEEKGRALVEKADRAKGADEEKLRQRNK